MEKLFRAMRQAVREFSEDDCMSSGAAIAYYAIFSLPPLLVVIAVIAGYFGVSQEQVNAVIEEQLGFQAAAVADDGAEPAPHAAADERPDVPDEGVGGRDRAEAAGGIPQQGLGIVSRILGVGVLLFAATGLFAQLQFALNRTWGVRPDPAQGGILRFVVKRVLSLGMVLVVAFLLLVSLVLTTVIELLVGWLRGAAPGTAMVVFAAMLNSLSVFLMATLLFAAMFKVLPDARVAWRDVLVGAALTGLLFVLGMTLIGWYLQHSDVGVGWGGAAAGMVGLLVWVYYSSLIVLYGAELTQVWAREFGHGFQPSEGAVRVERVPRRGT